MANLAKWQAANGAKRIRSEENQAVFAVSRMAAQVKLDFVEKNYERALEKLGQAIDAGEPWVLRAWLEAAGAVGTQHVQIAISNYLVDKLGIKDPDEAKKFIDAGRQYERLKLETSMDPQDAMNDGLDSLKFALSQRPEWRAKIVRELGGVMPESVNGEAA